MRFFLTSMAAASVLLAGVASAADGWSHYVNDALGFSCDKPDAMVFQTSMSDSPSGPAERLLGTLDLGPRGSVGVQAGRHAGPLPQDDDTVLDDIVRGITGKPGSVLDSVTPITVNGAPGREVQWHTADHVTRARLLLGRKSGERLFMIVGIGPSGPPSEFQRIEASFVPVP